MTQNGERLTGTVGIERFPLDKTSDPLESVLHHMSHMIDLVRATREDVSSSHRGFNVAAVGLGYYALNHEVAIFSAGNWTHRIPEEDVVLHKNMRKADADKTEAELKSERQLPKNCAEYDLLNAAEEDSVDTMMVMVTTATGNKNKIEEVTGRRTHTLHPCPDLCQPKIKESSIVPSRMLILATATSKDQYQFFTKKGLLKHYAQPPEDFQDVPVRTFNRGTWQQMQNAFQAERDARKLLSPEESWLKDKNRDPSRDSDRYKIISRLLMSQPEA